MNSGSATWTETSAPSPPRVSSILTPSLAQAEALCDDIFAPVLGHGLKSHELWGAYSDTLRAFSALLHSLSPRPEPGSRQISKAITEWAGSLLNDEQDVDPIVRVALADLRRSEKVVARLQERGLFNEFLRTRKGGMWISAGHGLAWGMLGLRHCSNVPDRISQEDLNFCLTLFRVGPLDAFAFVRAFELDCIDREESSDDFEPGQMHPDLEQLEAEEHDEHERLLTQLELGAEP